MDQSENILGNGSLIPQPFVDGQEQDLTGAMPLGGSASALIAGGSLTERNRIARDLRNNAWDVVSCPGATRRECPLLHNRRCEAREAVDVAIVFSGADANESFGPLACALHKSRPSVLVLSGGLEEARIVGDRAIIGALRQPDEVVGAASKVLPR